MSLLKMLELWCGWFWCEDFCKALSAGGLGFGHTESIPTDTELESALGFCFAHGLESCKQEGQTIRTLWVFFFQ